MSIWFSWAKSRNININIETMTSETLNEAPLKFYFEARKRIL